MIIANIVTNYHGYFSRFFSDFVYNILEWYLEIIVGNDPIFLRKIFHLLSLVIERSQFFKRIKDINYKKG